MTSTTDFRISSGKVIYYLGLFFGKRWIIILSAGIIFCLILGIAVSYKWFVVLLIWVCIILPMLLVFLYIFHGLRPLNAINRALHRIELNENDLTIQALHENEEGKIVNTYSIKVETARIKRIMTEPSVLVLKSEEPKGIVIIPYNSFIEDNHLNKLLSAIHYGSSNKPDNHA